MSAQQINAEHSFDTEFRGVKLTVHYDGQDTSNEWGPGLDVSIVAVTAGGVDVWPLIEGECEDVMVERARNDVKYASRRVVAA